MIGTTIGHFRVLEQIGAGGMGVVYRAHDTMLDRDVALKVISPKILVDDAVRQRFRKEALSVARLSHPNIATVFEMGSQGGTDFIVTELIPGIALDAKLRQAHALPEKEVLELALQLLDGLDAAHHQGVIHRDLKPSNLCMTAQGRLKIIDFGLALLKQTPADVESTVTITDPLEIRGTVPYMAPEQLRGEDLDARTDLWAVGVVLYELVTHQLPFPGTTSTAIAADIIHRQPIWPRVIQPEISAEFEKVILKSLEKDRRHRYQSASEVSADLKRLDHQFMRVGSKQDDPAVPLALELAHVLFMDIVGYSKLPMDQQRHCVYQLQELVSRTSDFIQAKRVDQLIALPTGDGMALAFFGDVQAPVRCAVELAQMVRPTGIEIRMGIHTGPVYRVADINANRNVTGGGINIAQRVMDCGDGGHILLSKAVADVLGEVTTWRSILRDLGEVTVKHGVRIHVYSLYTGEAGHPELPQKGRDDPNSVPAGITERLLQAAAPKESTIGTSIEIIAMVSEFGSPGLRTLLEEEAIPGLTSNDVRQRQFKINFPRDHQGNLQPVDISLRLDSPEFVPPTQTKKLRVPAEGDSAPCSFLIRPIVIGDLVVNLELLKGEEVVASRSIRTRALDHGRPVHPGKTIVCLPITIVASPSLLDKIRDVKQDIRDIDPRLLTKLGRVIPSTASPNEVRTDLGDKDIGHKGSTDTGVFERSKRDLRHAVESNEPLVSAILPKPASDSTATHEHRIGKYLVQGIIGRGGLGVVYKAVNPQVGMTVVIKTIVTDGDASLQALFMREARALAVLNNQNVVKVLDFGEQNGNPYLVTEFLEGSSLESIIKKGISLSLAAKLGIVIDVCNGLADAHNRPQPIIHRDIKPANITVQPDGTAVIINFGLAKIAGETGITKARQIVGSILYMSPEQLRGEDVDNRTDIYSTGVVLFQLLTGVPPFDAEETPVIVSKIVNEPPPPLSKFIRDYPPELNVILSRALSKRRADRYTDANDLKYDLTQLQSRL